MPEYIIKIFIYSALSIVMSFHEKQNGSDTYESESRRPQHNVSDVMQTNNGWKTDQQALNHACTAPKIS